MVASECTVFLDKPPCCLEFSPVHPGYFVVGTYNLIQNDHAAISSDDGAVNEPNAQRNGSLVLFRLVQNRIIQVSSIEVPYGVLDIHFCGAKLGIASSIGTFALYTLACAGDSSTPHLTHIYSLKLSGPDTVVTSFAWDPASDGARICTTLSTGDVHLVSLPNATTLAHEHPLPTIEPADSQNIYTHSLEAWITAFSPLPWHEPTSPLVFSGGDDAVLSCSTAASTGNTSPDQDPPPQPLLWTNRRIHTAGVTSILPLSLPELIPPDTPPSTDPLHLLATGSYDDTLRLLQLPAPPSTTDSTTPMTRRQPRVISEIPLPGGVWRLAILSQRVLHSQGSETETHPNSTGQMTMLASCMYAGAYVLRLTLTASSLSETNNDDTAIESTHEILGHFAEHDSICYACQAVPLALESETTGSREGGIEMGLQSNENLATEKSGEDRQVNRQIVSCSFYDRRVCLWRWTDYER